MRSATRLVIAAVAASGVALVHPARAQDEACKAPFERAQELRQDGRLVASRRDLASCVAVCPEALAEQCRIWIGEVEPQIGRLVVIVSDDKGRSYDDATIEIDGERVPRAEWQGAIPVDPGRHAVRITVGKVVNDRAVLVAQGGTERVTVILGKQAESPPEPSAGGGVPTGWFVLGGGGLAAALGGGAVFLAGHVLAGDYATKCEDRDPECSLAGSADWRSEVNRLWIAGGVVGGVGVAALGAAIIGGALGARRPPTASGLVLVPHRGGLGMGLRF